MGKDSYAYGSGGFTLVDNGNIPSVWLGTLRGPSIDVSMSINGLQTRVKTVTADYTLNGSDHTVLVDATAGAVIISMPAINQLPAGQRAIFRIVKIDGTANTVTVHAFPNFINGVSNLVVYERYAALEVTNNGVDWFVTTAHGVSFSPLHVPAFSTISWGSGNAANVGYLQIDGTPKLIISLSGTTQYQATSSDFSPITAGGKTLGAVQPWGVIFSNQGTNDGSFALTSGPTPAVNARNGNYQTLSVLTNIAVVIAVPTNPPATGFSQDLFIAIRNASGGALTTAPTFNTGAGGFKFAGGSIVNPANGTQVIYHWRWDPVQSFYCLVAVSGAL